MRPPQARHPLYLRGRDASSNGSRSRQTGARPFVRNGEGKMNVLAQRLRTSREHAGLSQSQVAKMLNLHRPTISEIEAGRRKVNSDELARFADIYEVSVAWLTG